MEQSLLNSKKVSVYVDEQLYETLRETAYLSKLSMSEILRACFVDWLKDHPNKTYEGESNE